MTDLRNPPGDPGTAALQRQHQVREGEHRRRQLAAPVLVLRHSEVYIVAVPFFGIVTAAIPVFSRKPLLGYPGVVLAPFAITGLPVTVWAHHMFPGGAVLLRFFSGMTFFIAVPIGVKFFNWIGSMWRGAVMVETPRRTAGPATAKSPPPTIPWGHGNSLERARGHPYVKSGSPLRGGT
jgi:hypothetical protein